MRPFFDETERGVWCAAFARAFNNEPSAAADSESWADRTLDAYRNRVPRTDPYRGAPSTKPVLLKVELDTFVKPDPADRVLLNFVQSARMSAAMLERAQAQLATLNDVLRRGGRHGDLLFASKPLYAAKSYLKLRHKAAEGAERDGQRWELGFERAKPGAWPGRRPAHAILFEIVEPDGSSRFPRWRGEGHVLFDEDEK